MKTPIVCFGLLLALTAPAWSQTALPDAELLVLLDAARFPDDSVTRIQVRITAISPDETRVAEVVVTFGEVEGDSVARIGFLLPEELAGQIYLSTPDATFFYAPDLDFPIKASATVELFGDAAVAQTSGIRFADGYEIASREVTVGGDGAERLALELVAVDETIAFQSISLLVDRGTLRPQSAKLYGLSGFPFYEVFYDTYEIRGDDDLYVSVQRIVSLIFEGRETISETLEIDSEALPADWFDPEALGAS
ncbi:MAG: outer membrane lipoprotein-sorting protein [Candidatus Bipolaricaulota bacterium]|nr:MAG: outer membrane lipoprotein-sorting protein [Candidatus Bipolaricaulota bacterium]